MQLWQQWHPKQQSFFGVGCKVVSPCLASAIDINVSTVPASASHAGSSPSESGSGKKGVATTVLITNSHGLLGVFLMVAVSVVGGVLLVVAIRNWQLSDPLIFLSTSTTI